MLSNRYTAIIRTDIYLLCKANLHLPYFAFYFFSYVLSSASFSFNDGEGVEHFPLCLLVISILLFEKHISTSLAYLLIALFGFLL